MISMLAGVCACSEDPAELIIEPSEPTIEELEAKVIENCFIVREAVMRFAMLNGGEYPFNVNFDTTPEGYTVIDLLPEGMLLVNPFTLCCTEPVDGTALTRGKVGCNPIVVGVSCVGFVITGVAMEMDVTIFTAHSNPDCTSISIYDEYLYCSGDCCD